MIIERVLNNNVVLSINSEGQEIVFMGKGIGFQKKPGDVLDENKIEKEFVLKDTLALNQFQQLIKNIPAEEIELVKQIVDLAEIELDLKLSSNIYLTLTDHLHAALQRAKENIQVPNPLLFETKKFYQKEYKIAKKILSIIEEKTDVSFSDDEAGFIAFHIVTSEQTNGEMEVTMAAPQMVRGILSIISKYFGHIFDEDSLNYQRLVTHLQFFTQRYLRGETHKEEDDEFLYTLIQKKYPKAFECVQRIEDYLVSTKQKSMDISEQIYLTIHIERTVNEKKS